MHGGSYRGRRGVAVALGGLRSLLPVRQHDLSVTQSGVCENLEAALICISGIIEALDPDGTSQFGLIAEEVEMVNRI